MELQGIRFNRESVYATALTSTGIISRLHKGTFETPSATQVRRQLLTGHVRLSENMAPDVFISMRLATECLGMTDVPEIYQAAGDNNAANWTCAETCFISLQGNMISLLDRETMTALLGHELGHHLAHTTGFETEASRVAQRHAAAIAHAPDLEPDIRVLGSRLAMAMELTADRYAAVAARGMDGPLRLLMTVVTGLPAQRLKADCDCYLAQARALFDTHGQAATLPVGSHPEHLLRAYALALFVETDAFRELTGQGPGTRKLGEVDDALHGILTASGEHFFEPAPDEPLPPEIQEFSLCAAVLMAESDGALDEAEATVLEDTFAESLPNWKELLDPAAALDRFGELLALAIAGGERVATSVFHLLVHVMLADREAHVRELEFLTAVGNSLRQEYLFSRLTAAVARDLRVERSAEVERPLPALPPGKHEAEAALNGLLAGIARRGGGSVNLARLLKITNHGAWNTDLRVLILRQCQAHHLELAAEPVTGEDGNAHPEQPLLLRLSQEESLRRNAQAHKAEISPLAQVRTHAALTNALRHLRERLVGGDGRSPSVRLYRATTGRHFDLAQLDRVISGRSERSVTLLYGNDTIPLLSGAEAGLHKTAGDVARMLRQLEREFKARVEETGSKDLFVGYPFLVGVAGGFFIRAPLALHPFSIIGDNKGAGSFTLQRREDDVAIANQALIRLLCSKKGYSFTEELASKLDAKAGEGIEPLLGVLREIGLEAQPLSGTVRVFEEMSSASALLLPEGLSVSEQAVLGFFPQSSSDLLQDYDELLAKMESGSPGTLEAALNAACEVLPSHYRPAFIALNDRRPDQPIIYADPSQRAAVLHSRGARLLVMDGPPGTGKSQTIVNLVADELSRGGRVGIVCEKRVALDVVKQRMDSAGIGHLAAVVHDVYDDRKALYSYIAERLEQTQRREFDSQRLDRLRSELDLLETQLSKRANLLATRSAGGQSLGQLHAMAASFTAPSVTISGLARVPHGDLAKITPKLRELHSHAQLFNRASPFRAPPGFARRAYTGGLTADEFRNLAVKLRLAHDAARIHEELHARQPLPATLLSHAESALQLIANFKQPAAIHALQSMLTLRQQPAAADALEAAFAGLEKHRAAAEALQTRVQMQSSKELTDAMTIAASKAGSFFRFFLPSWHKSCATIQAALLHEWPDQAGARVDVALLARLNQRQKAACAWQAAEALYQSLRMPSQLPQEANALYKQRDSLLPVWQTTGELALAQPALEALSLWPFTASSPQQAPDWEAWLERCRMALALLAAQNARANALQAIIPSFPYAEHLDAAMLGTLAERFVADEYALRTADRILSELEMHIPDAAQLIEILVDTLPAGTSSDWIDALLRGWAEACIEDMEAANPTLRTLDHPAPLGGIEQASARLLELHQQIAHEEALRLAASGDRQGLMSVNPAEARARRTPEQTARENLLRECRKQRRVMPMRTLARHYAKEGLLDVLPVWLMSPETTAILFPREPVFDLLIIDEASQCTVENGLPVLTRARRAVVAGDDKQMPPSAFFKANSGIEAEVDETDDVPADAFASESLLVLARHNSAGAPLRWHYRALFEELIAFSNHSMYGGSLLTIPATLSRSAPPAIRWVRLEDGVWEGGSNLPEARHVVDVLAELLARPKPPSAGIVTFNLQQRRAVLDEIDRRRADDTVFAEFYDKAASQEAVDLRPFVKNLESVQGDERDTIIFSLGYAPVQRTRKDGSTDTYVPARFGPLGQKGGERRLNVAVSRARQEVIVVSSFDPALLSVAHTKHDGPRMFKAFVEFARHMGEGRRNQAEKILALVNDAGQRLARDTNGAPANTIQTLPLHHQISLALAETGLQTETLIGSSEFRLPVAVVQNGDPNRYSLAVLCDDGSTTSDVFESYVHVPNVLKHRGWKHLRVDAREWHRDRPQVLARIQAALA